MRQFDAAGTAALLDYPGLMAALEQVLAEYQAGSILCPERLVVPCGAGLLMSMPCHAPDLVAHKLLTNYGANPADGLPAIQGLVTCFDAANGTPLFCLDGPTVTARRTAAVTMVGIRHLAPAPPQTMLLIGTGVQAAAHVEAALELYPGLAIAVRGRSPERVAAFCGRFGVAPAGAGWEADVVVAATSSLTPVYDEAALPGRLVVGVGSYRLDMVEVGGRVVRDSQVYVDDPVGAPGEAGDIVAAGRDWATVRPLAAALTARPDPAVPVFFKSVGCAAWDLAACRAARHRLGMPGHASSSSAQA